MEIDFNLIEKYLQGNATLSERIRVMKWAENSEMSREEFNALRRIYDTTLLMDDDVEEAAQRTGIFRRYWKWVAAAAVVVLLGGLYFLQNDMTGSQVGQQTLAFRSISAPVGQQTRTVLSDGTVVWLNSGSELEICGQGDGERRVKLSGEAFLDVAHDENCPFVVETSQMTVRVHGTQFNVNAYDDRQSVVLVSGSVDVTGAGQESGCRISPDEMFTYDAATGESAVSRVNTDNFVSWKEGFLQLDKAPLNQVFMQLQHFYGVRIDCDESMAEGLTISGKLELRTGLENALNYIRLLAPISYTYTGEREMKISMEK